MVVYHLDTVAAYAGDIGGAPVDLTEYDESIRDMKIGASKHGDLDYLRLAIDYLITHLEADAPEYLNAHYDYDEDETDELLRYIRFKVWGENTVANRKEVEKVELVDTMVTDWWEMRKSEDVLT